MENDPGASSGSGMAYERPQDSPNEENTNDENQSKKPKLAIVSELQKAGMTEVVTEFYEHKNSDPQTATPGLANRYQTDTSRTKGLLLNKKAE